MSVWKRTRPAQPGDQPACRGESRGRHLLGEFHLLSQAAALREVTEVGVWRAASTESWVLPHSSWGGFCTSRKRAQPPRWLCIFKRRLGTLALLLGQFLEKVAHALQSHVVSVEIGAQREVGVEGLQMQVDQAVDGGLHLGGIILTNLGAHG